MKKLYRFGATTFAALAAFAALGAGALFVATAVVIGGLLALAARLALNGFAQNTNDNTDNVVDQDATATA